MQLLCDILVKVIKNNIIDKSINIVYTLIRGGIMEVRLQKWGNSDGIRIPSSILKSLNIKTNDKLIIEQVEDKIVITVSKNKKISLKERFDNYNKDNLSKEFVWDKNVGKEIW